MTFFNKQNDKIIINSHINEDMELDKRIFIEEEKIS